MTGEVGRTLVVVVIIAGAVGIGLLATKVRRPHHPPADVTGLGPTPGIVIFTSTDCASCREALEIVRAQELPVREVTHELEASRLEAAGVAAVPLTVVLAADGRSIAQFAGVPPRRALRKAVARAGG